MTQSHVDPDIVYYSPMDLHEASAVSHLAASVFSEAVLESFEPEGVVNFLHFLSTENLVWRSHNGYFVLVAKRNAKVIGMIELRDHDHISLLFVDGNVQGLGIGRKLIELAVRECQSRKADLAEITVSATLNAVGFYERVGFQATKSVVLERGMRFVPMVLKLIKES